MSSADDAAVTDPLSGDSAPQALEAWLAQSVSGYSGPSQLSRFSGGQSNPTFRLTAPSGSYVLRRKPIGETLPSAHAVDREFRVLSALGPTDVPVPRVHALCEDPSVAGAMFYVMDLVPGRVFWDPRLPDLGRDDRSGIFDSMNRTIAAIHKLDPAAVGLDDYGRHENYLARQVSRWTRQYRAAETAHDPAMEKLIEWLPENMPSEGPARLVHGDYRLDNVLIHPEEPRIAAVLDWELSTLGDPRADFAYHAMTWRFAPDLFRGLEGVDFAGLGIPDEDAYVAAYAERSGFDPRADWDFFLILSMFRIAAILQGIAKRAEDGTAADAKAKSVGAKARPISRRAADLLGLTA